MVRNFDLQAGYLGAETPSSPNQFAYIGGNMAVATVAPRISSIQPSIITSEEISRYAEITSQLSQLAHFELVMAS